MKSEKNESDKPSRINPRDKKLHPLTTKAQGLRSPLNIELSERYRDSSVIDIIKSEAKPSVIKLVEMRESEYTPPQVRLQATQSLLNYYGLKLDPKEESKPRDINMLIQNFNILVKAKEHEIDVGPVIEALEDHV